MKEYFKNLFNRKLIFNARFCANMAFILFFSYRGWFGFFRMGRSRITVLFSIAIIYAFVLTSAIQSRKKNSEVLAGFVLVVICAVIFAITWVFHPEYGSWYFHHPEYNLLSSVFYPTGGIFAFLFIYLMDNVKDMHQNLRIVAWLMFFYAVYQLIPVIFLGHWNTTNAAGSVSGSNQSEYSLSFGYRTIICLIVFWTEYRSTGDRKYLILSAVTFLMVLMFGGRGALLAFLLFLFARYLSALKIRSRKGYLTIVLAVAFFALWYSGLLLKIIMGAIGIFAKVRASRSLKKLLNGSFFQDPARLRIWHLAVELIRTGGVFGHGPYGDRMVIGEFYSWGYCHNVLLELMVDFGAFGLAFAVLFAAGIIWFLKVMEPEWRDMLLIFVGLACQLLVSDSFWYNSAFWAILAFLIKHRKYLLSRRAVYSITDPDTWVILQEKAGGRTTFYG